MRRAMLLLAFAVLLVPASAWGGGFATAALSSTPSGIGAGEPWDVDITILQHGRTPMTDVVPSVVLALPGGGEKRFAGRPTDTPGVYRARVVFPAAGTYTYKVDDGFTNAVPHTFPAVQVGAAGAAQDDGGGFPLWTAVLLAAAAAAVLLAVSLRRGRARAPRRSSSSAAPRSARAGARGPSE
jgi:hypothetical protein